MGHAKVYYLSPDKQDLKGFEEVINSIDYDVMYLNGFFSPIFTIRPLLLRRMGKLKKKPVILTPRGDFTGGCENKKLKKYSYIYLVKLLGLYSGLLWHATSEIEERDIKHKFAKANVFTVPNLPAKFIPKKPCISKKPSELRLVFVSRIFPKKNIKYALEVLSKITEGNVFFDIYGPMEDKSYCLLQLLMFTYIIVRYRKKNSGGLVKWDDFVLCVLIFTYAIIGKYILLTRMNNALLLLCCPYIISEIRIESENGLVINRFAGLCIMFGIVMLVNANIYLSHFPAK